VYPTRPGQAFYTMYRGQHQRLPNGNLLLSESMAGRVIEVTAQGDIVWELINRYDEQDIASVNDAIRYPDGYLTVTDWSCSK
ncbi:MAG: arylsulfotransferase family protein, partial [Gemmatimonadota bacterium]|nr:arylsulfotransferase family protein [Gemmatimonadota bacterium]